MNTGYTKKIVGMIFLLGMVIFFNKSAYAATANIAVASGEVSEGDIVTAQVIISADAAMSMAELYISYDSALLEYKGGEGAGGAGLLRYEIHEFDETSRNKTIEIVFEAKGQGAANLVVDGNTRVVAYEPEDPNVPDMGIAATNGVINIGPPRVSSDCNLTGMTIQGVSTTGEAVDVSYIPEFSSELLEYKAEIGENIERIIVTTFLSDGSATTKVEGTKMEHGDNRTTVTVTASDGTAKTYSIYVHRPGASEPTTQEGETVPEESTEEMIDRSPQYIESMNKYLIQDFNLISVPEGYAESTAMFQGTEVVVLRGISKSLVLICLADDTEGQNAKFYILNEIDSSLSNYISLTIAGKAYTMLSTGDDYKGPEGYTQSTVNIDGYDVKCWVKEPESELCVVYAMSYNGIVGLYVYDKAEETIQRYSDRTQELEGPDVDSSSVENLKGQLADSKKKLKEKSDKDKMIIYGIAIAGVVLLIGVILLYLRIRELKDELKEQWDDEDGGEEDVIDISSKPENINQDSQKESSKTDVKENDGKIESVKEETKKKEPAKQEPVKKESVKEEAKKQEPAKQEPVKKEPIKQESKKEDKKDKAKEIAKEISKESDKEDNSKKEIPSMEDLFFEDEPMNVRADLTGTKRGMAGNNAKDKSETGKAASNIETQSEDMDVEFLDEPGKESKDNNQLDNDLEPFEIEFVDLEDEE